MLCLAASLPYWREPAQSSFFCASHQAPKSDTSFIPVPVVPKLFCLERFVDIRTSISDALRRKHQCSIEPSHGGCWLMSLCKNKRQQCAAKALLGTIKNIDTGSGWGKSLCSGAGLWPWPAGSAAMSSVALVPPPAAPHVSSEHKQQYWAQSGTSTRDRAKKNHLCLQKTPWDRRRQCL